MWWSGNQSRVERVMREMQRELFVPADQRANAQKDTALPIGRDQTISQPSLVARMTELLELMPHSRVLEIGTGSGYQTAILAELAGEVYTVERLADLAASAKSRLEALGYPNIHFRLGDGALGWPEAAPFGAIMVTAAPKQLPPALIAQLEEGGRMVAPIGSAEDDNQVLILVEKDRDGVVSQHELCPVRFVPLVSGVEGSRPGRAPGPA